MVVRTAQGSTMSSSCATQMNALNTLRTSEPSSVSSATPTLSTRTPNTTGSHMSTRMVSVPSQIQIEPSLLATGITKEYCELHVILYQRRPFQIIRIAPEAICNFTSSLPLILQFFGATSTLLSIPFYRASYCR